MNGYVITSNCWSFSSDLTLKVTKKSHFGHKRKIRGFWSQRKEVKVGPPSRNRTCGLQLRKLSLYPTELWAVRGTAKVLSKLEVQQSYNI